MSLEAGQALGIVTVDVCGVSGLLCAEVKLFVVEDDRFQWPALSCNAEPNFSSLILDLNRRVQSREKEASCART